MKKLVTVSALAIVLGFSVNAFAKGGFQGPQAPMGGYTGPSAAAMSVAEAKELRDDSPVVLVGKITKSLGGEKYLFTDGTETVTIEIDNEDWNGLSVSDKDTVEIRGEVDKGFTSYEIDVDSIAKK